MRYKAYMSGRIIGTIKYGYTTLTAGEDGIFDLSEKDALIVSQAGVTLIHIPDPAARLSKKKPAAARWPSWQETISEEPEVDTANREGDSDGEQ